MNDHSRSHGESSENVTTLTDTESLRKHVDDRPGANGRKTDMNQDGGGYKSSSHAPAESVLATEKPVPSSDNGNRSDEEPDTCTKVESKTPTHRSECGTHFMHNPANVEHVDESFMKFDDVINEEVESAIKRMIEESVQQVLGNKNVGQHVDKHVLQALTLSMEESLQGMIQKFSMDGKDSNCTSPVCDSDKLSSQSHTTADYSSCKQSADENHGSHGNMLDTQDAGLLCNVTENAGPGLQNCGSKMSTSDIVTGESTRLNCHTVKESDSDHLPRYSNENERLRGWKEAGKALREALTKYATTYETPNPLPRTVNTSIHSSQSLHSFHSDSQDVRSKSFNSAAGVDSGLSHADTSSVSEYCLTSRPCTINKPGSVPKVHDDASLWTYNREKAQKENLLARSMHQSLESDPMNQMWEEYQSSQIHSISSHTDPAHGVQQAYCDSNFSDASQDSSHSHDSHGNLLDVDQVDSLASGINDSLPSESKDPSLSELRERMRRLVSNLPITKKRCTGNGTAKESDSILTSSDSGIRTHLSPKNARRRHQKAAAKHGKESDLNDSEDEEEVNDKRSPPKHKAIHKKPDEHKSVKFSHRALCKQMDRVTPEKDVTVDSLPDLVTDTDSDVNVKSDQPNVVSDNKYSQSSGTEQNSCDMSSVTLKPPASAVLVESSSKQTASPALKQTESMLNFADVESGESEMLSSNVEDNIPQRPGGQVAQPKLQSKPEPSGIFTSGSSTRSKRNLLGASLMHLIDSDEDSIPSLESLSEEEEHVASKIIQEKYSTSCLKPEDVVGEEDDFDLFDDIPDLVVSPDTDEDHDITLSCKDMDALQEINITDSSLDEEDGVEADDEFECDCNLCQLPRDADHSHEDSDHYGINYLDDLSTEYRSMPSADQVDEDADPVAFLTPFRLLTSESNRRDLLDLMFTNVIMHMLSVYPDLLHDQTPTPVSPDLFDKFEVVTILQKHKDDDCSCPICLCNFDLADVAKQLPCGHMFHPLCIQAWLQKAGTCPVCRHLLTDREGTG